MLLNGNMRDVSNTVHSTFVPVKTFLIDYGLVLKAILSHVEENNEKCLSVNLVEISPSVYGTNMNGTVNISSNSIAISRLCNIVHFSTELLIFGQSQASSHLFNCLVLQNIFLSLLALLLCSELKLKIAVTWLSNLVTMYRMFFSSLMTDFKQTN